MLTDQKTGVLPPQSDINTSISFRRYSPRQDSRALTDQVVKCYRQVFADSPWNEWMQCPECGTYWGVKDKGILEVKNYQCCGSGVMDFWPRERVVGNLFKEITPAASCWLALSGSKVIGFCWGYPITPPELEDKLSISLGNLEPTRKVAYQAELGVQVAYRNRGIAKAMVRRRLSDFLRQGLETGVVLPRATPEPSVTFLWYKKLGYSIIARYPDADGRVIMAGRLDDISAPLQGRS
jgi:ribosomal protein S18 acetylase RimI-like enzyme